MTELPNLLHTAFPALTKKYAEIAKIRGDDDDEDYEDDGFEAALDSVTEEVWSDDVDEESAEE